MAVTAMLSELVAAAVATGICVLAVTSAAMVLVELGPLKEI